MCIRDRGQTEGETTEPERIEPDAYFEPIQSNDTANWPQGPAVWAESAVVMDLDSWTFLYSKNMDVAKYPASITKILTTLIAIEHSRPSEKVTFSENAVYGIEQGSSNIGIRLGENLTMEDLSLIHICTFSSQSPKRPLPMLSGIQLMVLLLRIRSSFTAVILINQDSLA